MTLYVTEHTSLHSSFVDMMEADDKIFPGPVDRAHYTTLRFDCNLIGQEAYTGEHNSTALHVSLTLLAF